MNGTAPGAKRTKSFAVVNDIDGIKTAVATVAGITTYTAASGTHFTGVEADAVTGVLSLPRTVTITTTTSVSTYVLDDITVTGKRDGATVIDVLNLTDEDGNETISGTQIFDSIVSVVLPAMDDTNGTIAIGVGDICMFAGDHFSGVEAAAAGNLVLLYDGGHTDTIPVPAAAIGFEKRVAPLRVKATTAIGVTVYLG